MKTLAVTLLLLLPGCAALAPPSQNFAGMSAQEIAATVKDKSNSTTCFQVSSAAGSVIAFSMNTDKGSITNGSATMKCGSAEATFTDSKEVKK